MNGEEWSMNHEFKKLYFYMLKNHKGILLDFFEEQAASIKATSEGEVKQ
jgi:hypothetical protein